MFPDTDRTAYDILRPDSEKAPERSVQELFVIIGKYVWLSGFAAMLLYAILSAIRMYQKTARAAHLKDNLYAFEEELPPFVMGIVRPRIYLPDFTASMILQFAMYYTVIVPLEPVSLGYAPGICIAFLLGTRLEFSFSFD